MKHLPKLTQPDPVASMEAMVANIAMEAFNLVDLANKGKDFLATLTANGHQVMKQAYDEYNRFSFKNSVEQFLSYNKERKYNEVMRLRVPCPEGFHGSISSYITELENATQQALRVQSDILIPLEQFLASLVSEPGFARDTRTHLKYLQNANHQRISLVRDLQKYFKADTKANDIFGDLYRNMNEWHSSYEKIQDLQNKIESIDREEILKKIARISELIGHVRQSNTSDELSNMSKTVVNELANGVYEAAKQVEQLSATSFAVYVLANNMNDTAKMI